MEAKRKEQVIDVDGQSRDAQDAASAGRRVPAPEVPAAAQMWARAAARPQTEVPSRVEAPPAAEERAWSDAPQAGGEQWPPLHGAAGQPLPQRPHSKAARPEEAFYLPRADWRWPAAVAGLVAGAAPQALLQFASVFAGGTSSGGGSVTTTSAIAIAVSSLVLYGWQALAAWLFSLRNAGRSLILWGFRRPTRAFFWVVPAGLGGVYAAGVVHDLIVHPKQQAIVSAFPHNAVGIAMFALVAVVLAPVFEEILFRGFLFRGLANSFGWVWAALLSAAIFGAAHLQLDVFLPLAALGFVLAWAYHHTGSLWTAITMHAVFNTVAVLAWALTG